MTKRHDRDDRRSSILTIALSRAADVGYMHVTREDIALAAGCSPALVSHHLGTMKQMRRAIMGEAIRTANLRIIAQGLAHGDPRALGADPDLRSAAAASIAGV